MKELLNIQYTGCNKKASEICLRASEKTAGKSLTGLLLPFRPIQNRIWRFSSVLLFSFS